MGKVIDFNGYKNRDVLAAHRSEINALVKDINASTEPEITLHRESVVITWTGTQGNVIIVFNPATGYCSVNCALSKMPPLTIEATTRNDMNNRWIGYWFDDNCHD